MQRKKPTQLKIAEGILYGTGAIASMFLIAMLIWGFIYRPLGTLACVAGATFLIAFFWAFIVAYEW